MILIDGISPRARIVTASTTITAADTFILFNNGAAAVTQPLPPIASLPDGFTIHIGIGQTSTGTITLTLGAGATGVQALAGTVGATTTISAHNAVGAGLGSFFIKIGTIWYRRQ